MKKNKIIGIKDIDTRALTGKIRDEGVMKGIITPVEDKDFNDAKVPNDANNVKEVKEAKALPSENELNLVKEVTTGYKISVGTGDMKIALIDFGVKMNIVRSLQEFGFTVTIYPAYTPPSEILKDKPDGIVLSNGPGDPKTLGEIIENTKELINSNIPIMGICLGHQILSLAFGAKTYKLKFGHRGGNHPIKDLQKNKVYITSQNHGYAVDESTLPSDVEITHINLNDKTVEGIRHKSLPIFSIQYHPEASPGPMDSVYLFEGFKEMIENKLKEEGKGGNNNARK